MGYGYFSGLTILLAILICIIGGTAFAIAVFQFPPVLLLLYIPYRAFRKASREQQVYVRDGMDVAAQQQAEDDYADAYAAWLRDEEKPRGTIVNTLLEETDRQPLIPPRQPPPCDVPF